jgi:hypothetical protein
MDMQTLPTEAPRRIVRRPRIDVSGQVVTLGSVLYTASGMPANARDYLTTLGLKTALLSEKNPDATYTRLISGIVPAQRPPTPIRRSKAREAIANTLAQAAASAAAPRGAKKTTLDAMIAERLEAMRAHVATLPPDTVRALAKREDVAETYRRLFNPKDDGQQSLLVLAGVNGPLPLPDETDPAPF